MSDTLPWTAAGRGYVIDVFSDGTDCRNAATALVIRARPMLPVDPGIESTALVVLMSGGGVVEVGSTRQN